LEDINTLNQKTHIMTVLYRITSIPSTNPSPIHQDDKDTLNEVCLRSFLRAFWKVSPKIIFLADNCSPDCIDMIKRVSAQRDFEIKVSQSDINNTMLISYLIAKDLDDEVLFQECDYVWKPNSGKVFESAVKELGLVSPYDHANFYSGSELHSDSCLIKLVDEHHFRSTERNTMTWGCHSSLVKENIDILNKHGYLDGQVWYDLHSRGHNLYVPIPSLATHMVKDYIAPGFDWKAICQNIL